MERNLTFENQKYVTIIEGIFGTRTQKIVEGVLDKNKVWVCHKKVK